MIPFSKFINEVKIIGRGAPKQPLKDSDTIRVYHGASDIETIVKALTYGISGDRKAPRRYSYENNNNPTGLFVSPDLDVSKEFGDYVLEFHTRVFDLIAPIWPGGSFTVQGGMAQMFSDEDERTVERAAQKARITKDASEHIFRSESPDVAYWLMDSGETQALFTGNLNKNSIRAVWVSTNPERINQPYKRMKPKEFMKQFNTTGIDNRFGSKFGPDNIQAKQMRDVKNRLVEPRENITLDILVSRYVEKFSHMTRDGIIDILRKSPDYIDRAVWNQKQVNQVQKDLQSLNK